MRKSYVGGNWKMNTTMATGATLAQAIVDGHDANAACEVVVFPPFTSLATIRASTEDAPVRLGAQDVWHQPDGAFTGEVSCGMLRDVGVEVVLVGHSERRHVIGESDDLVNQKLRAALAAGFDVVLCVGETLEEREAGSTDAANARQLAGGLADVPAADLARVVIAYEPVWAIGTGRTATPADAGAAHRAIRRWLSEAYDLDSAEAMRIQYGGSVKPTNAAELGADPDIDGFLVGGASLSADDFLSIIGSITTPPTG